MTAPYHPPLKRSLAIHGHKTSISLEPLFWSLLKEAAAREGIAAAQLVARIDGERIRADPAPGLASAIRVWLVAQASYGNANERSGGIAPAAPADRAPADQ